MLDFFRKLFLRYKIGKRAGVLWTTPHKGRVSYLVDLEDANADEWPNDLSLREAIADMEREKRDG